MMMEYSKRLVEVDEVLSYLSIENLLKIPENIRNAIKENKDKEYVWKYDINKSLKEQNLSRDTIAFLSYLNMEYLLNEEEKQVMQEIHKLNDKKIEQEKMEKYSTKDLFKSKIKKQEEISSNNILTVYKENIFQKILKKIKNLF